MGRYAFPLCIQLTLPEDMNDVSFRSTLEQLERLGFYGVELNVTDFNATDPVRLKALLGEHGLTMTMLASGAYAKRRDLSLSAPDEATRRRSVAALCDVLMPFARAMDCGIICGFIKGGADGKEAQLAKTIDEISGGEDAHVPVYLEATNHYESAVVNWLEEGARLIRPPFRLLPDTYHMNIEESDISAGLAAHKGLYDNLHISDSNRCFPGFGHIDFPGLFRLLKALDYGGTMAIEGRCRRSLAEDIELSCAYLRAISEMSE